MIRGWSWLTSSGGNGFGIIQTPFGTAPTATTANDTLTFTSTGGTVTITGNSGTKTINLESTGGGSPAGVDRAVQFNNSSAFGGSTSVQIDAADHLNVFKNGIGTTVTTGVHLHNTTAATGGAQIQASPAILFEGQAWKSFAPAASQTTIWRAYNRLNPYSATTTGGDLRFDASVNGGAYNTVLTLASGSAQGITDANLTLSGRYIVNFNNSDASPSTAVNSPAWRINNTGAWSHLSFAFSGAFRGALSVSSAGDVRNYTSDKYTWIRDFSALTQLAQLNNDGLQVQAGYGLFAGEVTAGFIDATPPATLNTRGSYAVQGNYVSGQSFYQILVSESVTYVDVDGATTCTGTPGACTTYVTQVACELVDDCVWSAGSACSAFDGTDEATCEANSGCTWDTASCAVFTDQTNCEAQSPCAWGNTGDCSAFSGDQTTCEATTGCSWSDPDCSGNYDACSGDYDTGVCSGTYGSGCSGTVLPCYDQTNCTDAGCTSVTGTTIILPPASDANQVNTSRFQWVKNIGASNNVIVIPYPGDSLEGTSTTLDPAASAGYHHLVGNESCAVFVTEETCTPTGCAWTNGCSAFGDQTSCEEVSGCSWDSGTDTCSGNFTCTGSYAVVNRWNIMSLYT